MKYFSFSEFDSPLEKGSGLRMDTKFLEMLEKARERASVPFKITSGYRVPADIERLLKRGYKVSKNSSHLKGLAADISTLDSGTRYKIIEALIYAGFTRIGIANTFIHVDCDPDKPQNVIWTY